MDIFRKNYIKNKVYCKMVLNKCHYTNLQKNKLCVIISVTLCSEGTSIIEIV